MISSTSDITIILTDIAVPISLVIIVLFNVNLTLKCSLLMKNW